MEHLQTRLRQKVGRMNLTIEVNPSSNLLIGHLGEMGHHPLWRLAPAANQDGTPPLSVCIGSDDPLTFATTLPEEYQLLYDALMKNDCSNATAHDWLERARKAGMSSRFTLPVRGKARQPIAFGSVSGDLGLDPPP
jgi:adenosine deaminase